MNFNCSTLSRSIPSGFTLVAADRKWFFGVVRAASNSYNRLGHSQTVRTEKTNTSATMGATPKNYFQLVAATVKSGPNRLGLPPTVRIHHHLYCFGAVCSKVHSFSLLDSPFPRYVCWNIFPCICQNQAQSAK